MQHITICSITALMTMMIPNQRILNRKIPEAACRCFRDYLFYMASLFSYQKQQPEPQLAFLYKLTETAVIILCQGNIFRSDFPV